MNIHKDFQYVLNPYYQLSCWVLYRLHDYQMGEKMLALLLELKELLLQFDTINKQRFQEDFDNDSPYNIWLYVIISQYINRHIDKVRIYFLKKTIP